MLAKRLIALLALAACAFCAQPVTSALAIHRSVALARGYTWLYDGVPYSQQASHDGYRTDCSGFVSMAWNLRTSSGAPLALSTRTLVPNTQYNVTTRIATASVLPGDAFIDPGHHTFLFVKWNDAAKTSLTALEQASTASDMQLRTRLVANLSGYLPYRYKGIEADPAYGTKMTNIEGTDRYATAIEFSKQGFNSGADSVVIASGTNWPDALGGAGLAGAAKGPILLVPPGSTLPKNVSDEIKRLGATRAYVLGGTAAVSSQTAEALEELPGVTVRRIAGQTRYDTAAAIASETVSLLGAGWDGNVFLASGANYADALAASAVSASLGRPILLTEPSRLTDQTRRTMVALGTRKAIVLGGEGAVSLDVETALQDNTQILSTRWAGEDRYATAIDVAMRASEQGMSFNNVAIASGQSFADALAGGPMQAQSRSIMLLNPNRGLDARVRALLLKRLAYIGKPRILGGDQAISYLVRDPLYDALVAGK
jgi:putative cell wall-binding protein